MEYCNICNRKFSSKNSLRSHKSRYHKTSEKVLNPVIGNNISGFKEDNEKTRKRFRSNEDLSEQSEDESELALKEQNLRNPMMQQFQN